MEKNNFKAVIFDLDGTLLDTIGDIATPVETVLKRYGFPGHDREMYRQFIGNGIGELVYRALPIEVAESTSYNKLLGEVWREYGLNLNKSSVPYDGIYTLLDSLAARGIILNILSNKSDEFMDEVVSEFFAKWNFAMVFGARPNKPLKPDPYSVYEILEEIELDAGQCVFVGDSDVDMQTAVNAGVYPVGVSWGFRKPAELKANGAELIIEHPLDLLKLFD